MKYLSKRQFHYCPKAFSLKDRVLSEKEQESIYELARGSLYGVVFTIYHNGPFMRIDFTDLDNIPLNMADDESEHLVKYDSTKTLAENVAKANQTAINDIYDLDEEDDFQTSQDNPFGSWGAYDNYRYGNYWHTRNRNTEKRLII